MDLPLLLRLLRRRLAGSDGVRLDERREAKMLRRVKGLLVQNEARCPVPSQCQDASPLVGLLRPPPRLHHWVGNFPLL